MFRSQASATTPPPARQQQATFPNVATAGPHASVSQAMPPRPGNVTSVIGTTHLPPTAAAALGQTPAATRVPIPQPSQTLVANPSVNPVAVPVTHANPRTAIQPKLEEIADIVDKLVQQEQVLHLSKIKINSRSSGKNERSANWQK